MRIGQKLRQTWHDWFYRFASERQMEFALKCQHVAKLIDLHEKPQGILGPFRLALHLTLCQACKNYYGLSRVLGRTVQNSRALDSERLQRLNRALIHKYSDQDQSTSSQSGD